MHPKFRRADELSAIAIAAALEVHRDKGPGLLESIYEKCLAREFELRQVAFKNQQSVMIEYKGFSFDDTLRLDFILDDCLVLEIKAVQSVLPIHKAQLMSYMKLVDAPLGLVINFNELMLKTGIARMMLPGANV